MSVLDFRPLKLSQGTYKAAKANCRASYLDSV